MEKKDNFFHNFLNSDWLNEPHDLVQDSPYFLSKQQEELAFQWKTALAEQKKVTEYFKDQYFEQLRKKH